MIPQGNPRIAKIYRLISKKTKNKNKKQKKKPKTPKCTTPLIKNQYL